jgi:hypothetical protein
MTITLHGTIVVLLLLAAAVLFALASIGITAGGRAVPAGLCFVAIALMLQAGGL